jgi:CTP:molybdopterin cytidylyltransferase MocA
LLSERDHLGCREIGAYGAPKQLLSFGDRSLLQLVLDQALASSLDEIVIVLGHRAAEIRATIEIPPESTKPVRLIALDGLASG